MKKQKLKNLKLSKSCVSNFNTIKGGSTCQGPCQGGTGCCNGTQGVCYDPESYSGWQICICDIEI